MFRVPEKYRRRHGEWGSNPTYGNNGQFLIRSIKLNRPLMVQASDGDGWEHVSVSMPDRCPTWEEMCFVKKLFWDDDDLVIQLHPPKSEYVNCHPYCLHLWRKLETNHYCDVPPSYMVGTKKKVRA